MIFDHPYNAESDRLAAASITQATARRSSNSGRTRCQLVTARCAQGWTGREGSDALRRWPLLPGALE